jgi:hypothetical protein
MTADPHEPTASRHDPSQYLTARETARLQKQIGKGGDFMKYPLLMKTVLGLILFCALLALVQAARYGAAFADVEADEIASVESTAGACVTALAAFCCMGLFFWLRSRIVDNQIIIKLHRQLQELRGAGEQEKSE